MEQDNGDNIFVIDRIHQAQHSRDKDYSNFLEQMEANQAWSDDGFVNLMNHKFQSISNS